jgi:hypothetical protein
MRSRFLFWLLVPATYVVLRLASRRLVSDTWHIDPEMLTHMAVVPIAQIVVLVILRRLLMKRSSPAREELFRKTRVESRETSEGGAS